MKCVGIGGVRRMAVLVAAADECISSLDDDRATVTKPVAHDAAPVGHIRLYHLDAIPMAVRADHGWPASRVAS